MRLNRGFGKVLSVRRSNDHLSTRLSRVEDTYRVKVYLVYLIRMMLKNRRKRRNRRNRRKRRRKIARGKSL